MLALTILGSNSAIAAFGRNPTSQLLQTNEDFLLIDCGEGTQMQMSKFKVKKSNLETIKNEYFTHNLKVLKTSK